MLLPSSLSCEKLFFNIMKKRRQKKSHVINLLYMILICIHMWMNSQFLAGRTLLMLRSFFCCCCSPLTHSVEWCAWYNGNNVKLWTDWNFFKLFPFSEVSGKDFFYSLMFLTWQRCLDVDWDKFWLGSKEGRDWLCHNFYIGHPFLRMSFLNKKIWKILYGV